MEIEKLAEMVAGERAVPSTKRPLLNTAQMDLAAQAPAPALSIDVLESMCRVARGEGFEEGYRKGVASAMAGVQGQVKWAGHDGETAGMAAGLDVAGNTLDGLLGAAAMATSAEEVKAAIRGAMIEVDRLRNMVRENGLHGEREF